MGRPVGREVLGGNEEQVRAIELKPLIGRLNDVCRRALEAAAGVTALRAHYNVEIEHLLIGLLDRTDTDFAAILRKWDVEPARLLADLNRSPENEALYPGRFETGLTPLTGFGGEPLYLPGREPDSDEVVRRVEQRWRT